MTSAAAGNGAEMEAKEAAEERNLLGASGGGNR